MRRWLLLAISVFAAGAAQADEARLSFTRGGYWLTNPAPADFTLHQEQAAKNAGAHARARLALYKLSDPALLAQIVTARALKSLSEAELLRRVAQTPPVWQGDLVLPDTGDIQIPVEAATGTLGSGVYVLTAAPGDNEARSGVQSDGQRVAQWFIRSTLALNAQFMGGNGGDRSYVTGYDTVTRLARADVQLRWCDADGKVVGEEKLPDTGTALVQRPATAALLIATATGRNADFDYVAVPQADKIKPVDGALIYPSAASREPGRPFSFLIAMPGEAAPVMKLNGADVPPVALIPGLWRVDVAATAAEPSKGALTLVASRDGKVLASSSVPAAASGHLSVTWLQRPKAITTLQPTRLEFRLAKAGKVAASQDGMLLFEPAAAGAQPQPALQLPFRTDARGIAGLTVPANALPAVAATYQIVVDAAGQQSAAGDDTISAYPAQSWLAIAPQFSDGAVAENVTAQFTVTSRRVGDAEASAGQAVAVQYQLAREAYKFEWYQADDGRWLYRTKTTLETVLDGEAQPAKGVTTIAVPVSAGRYRLTVDAAEGGLQAAQSFTAGWWLMQPAPATPEKIELTAQVEGGANNADDKSRIAIFIDPPFAAHVWVAAVNASGGAALPMVDVPDDGGFAYLPRTALQPGQPLLLKAYGVPRDAGAPLAQAAGMAVLPLGSKIDMKLGADEDARGLALALDGLPVDQPLDRNIAQAFLALYDDSDLSLWQAMKVMADNGGAATVELSAGATAKPPAKIRARLFTTAGDRLNVAEQVLIVPAKIKMNTTATTKRAPALVKSTRHK